MTKKLGFIGVGNMGGAILKGLIKSNVIAAKHIYTLGRDSQKNKQLAAELGTCHVETLDALMKTCDSIIIGIKPKDIPSLLENMQGHLQSQTLIISVAAGVTLDTFGRYLGEQQKVVRVMPNTPALVNEAMSSITPNENVSETEIEWVKNLFNSIGKAEVVPEYLINAVVGASGSSPAYIFMLIEAMADAVVLGGMPRQQAYTFVAQAVLGSAKMVLETGMHPGALKDMVCSPSGTTIEGVCKLEEKGFRSAIIEAIKSCMDKSEAMSKKA